MSGREEEEDLEDDDEEEDLEDDDEEEEGHSEGYEINSFVDDKDDQFPHKTPQVDDEMRQVLSEISSSRRVQSLAQLTNECERKGVTMNQFVVLTENLTMEVKNSNDFAYRADLIEKSWDEYQRLKACVEEETEHISLDMKEKITGVFDQVLMTFLILNEYTTTGRAARAKKFGDYSFQKRKSKPVARIKPLPTLSNNKKRNGDNAEIDEKQFLSIPASNKRNVFEQPDIQRISNFNSGEKKEQPPTITSDDDDEIVEKRFFSKPGPAQRADLQRKPNVSEQTGVQPMSNFNSGQKKEDQKEMVDLTVGEQSTTHSNIGIHISIFVPLSVELIDRMETLIVRNGVREPKLILLKIDMKAISDEAQHIGNLDDRYDFFKQKINFLKTERQYVEYFSDKRMTSVNNNNSQDAGFYLEILDFLKGFLLTLASLGKDDLKSWNMIDQQIQYSPTNQMSSTRTTTLYKLVRQVPIGFNFDTRQLTRIANQLTAKVMKANNNNARCVAEACSEFRKLRDALVANVVFQDDVHIRELISQIFDALRDLLLSYLPLSVEINGEEQVDIVKQELNARFNFDRSIQRFERKKKRPLEADDEEVKTIEPRIKTKKNKKVSNEATMSSMNLAFTNMPQVEAFLKFVDTFDASGALGNVLRKIRSNLMTTTRNKMESGDKIEKVIAGFNFVLKPLWKGRYDEQFTEERHDEQFTDKNIREAVDLIRGVFLAFSVFYKLEDLPKVIERIQRSFDYEFRWRKYIQDKRTKEKREKTD